MGDQKIKRKSAKAKARRLQNWAAQKISEITLLPSGKDELIEPRQMGQSGVDVRLTGEAREKFPWSIECKAVEVWNVPKAIKQAKENKLAGTEWVVIMKKSSETPVAIIDANVFFSLISLILKT